MSVITGKASRTLTSIEICAGAGGSALGIEQAGFCHLELIEIDRWACETLRRNRPDWNVTGPSASDHGARDGKPGDIRVFDATSWRGHVDLLSGGVPCPPFTIAGRQLGRDDERDLFPEAIRLAHECQPRAIMIENVGGILGRLFDSYRAELLWELGAAGYHLAAWSVVQASEFGVPQLRPRAVLVAFADPLRALSFRMPRPMRAAQRSVGVALGDLMAAGGWEGASAWAARASRIAPTLVGGSKKHGGPDLGPTRARQQWAALGVDGSRIADGPPPAGFEGRPQLTVEMAARLQGFPEWWRIEGPKTPAYRQVGNAFPPPVSLAIGERLREALLSAADIDDDPELAA